MTYTPSELFTNQYANIGGNWIDPKEVQFVSKVLDDNSFAIQMSDYEICLDFDDRREAQEAHDALLQAWDMAIQRETMQKQFEQGLEIEEPHGVTLSVNMPLDTPKDTIKSAIFQASAAILDTIDDVGGGL